MQSKELSDSRKEQRKSNMRKSEANFLRFLRTSERPQNYNTLKIIGKGAFGEVRLVQRKHDGKIYALKSLIKAEMVLSAGIFRLASLIDYWCSTRKTSLRTSGLSATSSPTPTVLGS